MEEEQQQQQKKSWLKCFADLHRVMDDVMETFTMLFFMALMFLGVVLATTLVSMLLLSLWRMI